MSRYTLIIGDAATYEEGGIHRTDFQTVDFIAQYAYADAAIKDGERAITGAYDTYVIPELYKGIITFNAGEAP